jgi:hypothetical protein
MPPRSSLRKLPTELRDELDKLLRGGRHTIREITDHLRVLGVDTSKSAVHRYSQDFERVAEDIRLTREMARAVGRELGDAANNDATRMLVESMQALVLRARMQLSTSDEIETKAVADLARSIKDLQGALRGSVDIELKIRSEVAREAAKAAEESATRQGLTAETIEAIKAQILGVAKRG